ncbi:MAG: FAD/NAD(P)-binding protein [Pyrinomonadaceae bacterium]|nr:FAD/NAD(P)-binding protein [Phycisphaerales bacterium]
MNAHTNGSKPGSPGTNGYPAPSRRHTRLRVGIVGAGFCGSTLAVRLLRSHCAEQLEIILLEREGVFGPGLAFGKARPTNLLNVPAGNMSALDDDAGHFLRWAQELDPATRTGDFLPRRLYGQYIKQLLDDAAAQSRALFTRVAGDAADVRKVHAGPSSPGESAPIDETEIVLASGQVVRCDQVVLCLGNFPPAPLAGLPDSLELNGSVVGDPWNPLALANLDPEADLLLVGTGLTMVDIASELRQAGHRGTVHAVSRRGLLPASHRGPSKPPAPRQAPEQLASWDGKALSLLRIMRGAITQATLDGIDWREVITSIRGITPSLWQRMDLQQRQKFIRHIRTYWETARHRVSPVVAKGLKEAMAQGSLVIHAGRITSATQQSGKVAVCLAPRGSAADEARILLVSRVINCTGPECDIARSDDRLLQSLVSKGQIRPDPLRMGADCTPAGAVIDRDGIVSDFLYVAGPLRKGLLWETTAVPELRKQVSELAAHLTATLRTETPVVETRTGTSSVAGHAI